MKTDSSVAFQNKLESKAPSSYFMVCGNYCMKYVLSFVSCGTEYNLEDKCVCI